MPRVSLRATLLASCAATAILSGGCATSPDEDLEAARAAEAQELRDQLSQTQSALEIAEERAAALEDELASRRAEWQDERADLLGQLQNATTATPSELDAFSGPGVTATLRGSDIVVEVAGDVLFASGSVALRNNAKQTLDRIASTIASRYPANEIEIAGHTDNDPIRKSKWETNERLSAERALAVENYLATRGISKDRMHVAGFGPAKPRGTKQQSRRVEIIVLGNPG